MSSSADYHHAVQKMLKLGVNLRFVSTGFGAQCLKWKSTVVDVTDHFLDAICQQYGN